MFVGGEGKGLTYGGGRQWVEGDSAMIRDRLSSAHSCPGTQKEHGFRGFYLIEEKN